MRKILDRRESTRQDVFLAALLSACAFALCPASALADIPQSEREALIAVYNSLGGGGWSNRTGCLDPPGSECSWYGVTCDASQTTVIGLDLSNNNLGGAVPAEVAHLVSLQLLDLSSPFLTGSLPPELGTLKQLRSLRLETNPGLAPGSPAGSIPPELGNLTNLEVLVLGGHMFSGTRPIELGNLTKLRVLNIAAAFNPWSRRGLTGSIPAVLGNLSRWPFCCFRYDHR